MPLKFERFTLLYPPRPKGAINPAALSQYSGFIAQYKYNDTRNLIYVFPDGEVEFFNRHKQKHVLYKISPSMRRSIHALGLRAGVFHVLDGGLLHNKTRAIKDRVVLWDILVHNGEYLVGTTYIERYKLLLELASKPLRWESETSHRIAYRINENLWLAPVFTKDLVARYASLIHLDEIEGLVLKDPRGRLEWGLQEANNGAWQIRVRKPSRNYAF